MPSLPYDTGLFCPAGNDLLTPENPCFPTTD
jgi:hypothetical protein